MPKNISLFPHNEIGYQKLVQGLSDYPLAFLEHATGTGKSFILLKYLYLHQRFNRILFITMHDEMFDQLFNGQMHTLGMDRSDFKCFDTMIYPNIIKYNMQDIINKYDCIICDEAHHCGAPKWSISIDELKELVLKTPGKKMIGATATGTRYLDNYLDVAERFFNGHTVSRLPISTSMLNNLLPAPLVVNTLASCNTKIERVIGKLNKLPKTLDTIALRDRLLPLDDKIKRESNVANTLQKYGVKPGEKYIVFCSSIADVQKKITEAQEWFKDIGPIKTFTAHSGQKKDQNRASIAAFSESRPEISLMFAVDIFNEGFHIEGVDGILMFRKTKSPIVYFQQLGRALSFSVRKKQIKIFDFVDNISNNDVIYELYREVINEARRLTKLDPSKKDFYEEILRRFQIIDETTQIIDELNAIEKIIDENYIAKNNIEQAISKLEEYRIFYPHTDFNKELTERHLGRDYVNAYNFICRMNEELTIDQTERLRALNIRFSYEINLPKSERLELLKGYPTIKKLKEAEFNTFQSAYITFVTTNHRRPSLSEHPLEKDLYLKYRAYLNELSPHKLTKFVNNFTFPCTVEEIVLTGNYPSKEALDSYIAFIKEKITNGQQLDKIEIKVTRKLVHTISLKDVSLATIITNYNDKTTRIEEAIAIIANYQKMYNPKERFTNIKSFMGERTIYNALRTIYKYAPYITTSQFIKLLELSIQLPPSIDMTLAERKEKLGDYSSFYELEQGEGTHVVKEYISYIHKYHHRPTGTREELKLEERYNRQLMRMKEFKIGEVCSVLKYFHIPLTLYEQLASKEPIPIAVINNYVADIVKKLRQGTTITKDEIKILRAINRNHYITQVNLDNLINEITKINEISGYLNDIETLLNQGSTRTSYAIKCLLRKITNNYKYLTSYHLERLNSLQISIADELVQSITNLNGFLNIYEQETIRTSNFITNFISYITNFHARPLPTHPLAISYRNYLASSSRRLSIKLIKKVADLGIPLLFEEKVLGDYQFSNEELVSYKDYIEKKITNHHPLDRLEARIISNLQNKGYLQANFYNPATTIRIFSEEEKLERKIVARLRENIARNPLTPINFESTLYKISPASRRQLEEFRLSLLSANFLKNVLSILKKSKLPLTECLTVSEYREFQKFSSLKNPDSESLALLNTINSLDHDYRFLQRKVEKDQTVTDYIAFIASHYGNRPSLNSSSDEELALAITFDELKPFLTATDFQKIEAAIRENSIVETSTTFYERFIAFIMNNGRFPCGNSDNPDEVLLNNMYVNFSSSLSKEQLINLRKLRKKYSQATVKANLEFTKKHQIKK